MKEWIIKTLFPGREEFGSEFQSELHYQCSRVILPASFICIFAWINYIPVDGQLYPGEPHIITLRYGLSAVGLLIFIAQFIPVLKKKSMYLLFVLGVYLQGATAVITALTKGDPVYFSGYIFVVMILTIMPFIKVLTWILLFLSLALFMSIGISKGMAFATLQEQYRLNDLLATAGFVIVFIYVLDRIRFQSWQKSVEIQKHKENIQVDKERIDSIVAETKDVLAHLDEATGIISGYSKNVDTAIREQSELMARSRVSNDTVISSFDRLKIETNNQLEMNIKGKGLTEQLRGDMKVSAQSSSAAIEEAHKIKILSDECDIKLQNSRNAIEKLKEESSRIEEISQTINDIADQTNLLSLNASIESARAGDHGRGFAVVADEISKLAEKSISSAREISGIIMMSVSRINEASEQIEETSTALKEIVSFLENNRSLLEDFGTVIQSQVRDVQLLIDQLENSLDYTHSIDRITDENAREIDNSRMMMEEIEKFYNNLGDMSARLLQLSESLAGDISRMKNVLYQSR